MRVTLSYCRDKNGRLRRLLCYNDLIENIRDYRLRVFVREVKNGR